MLSSHRCLIGLASLTLCLPAGLHAQVGFGTSAQAIAVQNNGSYSGINLVNGVRQGTDTGNRTGGGSAVATFGSATVAAAASSGRAELATGIFGTTSNNASSVPGAEATATSRAAFNDTLTFTNSSSSYQFVTFSAVVPGVVSVIRPGSLSAANSTFVSFQSNDPLTMVLENEVMVFGQGQSIYYRMNASDSNGARVWFEDQNGRNSFNNIPTGGLGAIMTTQIGFRPGTTVLQVSALSDLDCRFSTTCDYSNTRVQFSALPTGLSYTSASGAFRITPSNTAPTVNSAAPAFGQGTSMTRTFVFADADGTNDLGVVNLLINSALDGRNACYLAYDSVNNVLVLQTDAGDNATVLALPSTASLSNSQCSIPGSAITAVKTSSSLSLTMTFNFTASFTGTRVVFAAARDRTTGNSNWQAIGTQTVTTPAANPQPLSATPSSGRATVGVTFPVTATYRDATASTNLQPVQLLINRDLDGANACYFGFDHVGNNLFLVGDSGTLQPTPIRLNGAPGGAASIENTQCRVLSAGSTFLDSGNTLTMTLQIQFKGGSVGRRLIYAGAQTTGGANSGWSVLGSVTVQ